MVCFLIKEAKFVKSNVWKEKSSFFTSSNNFDTWLEKRTKSRQKDEFTIKLDWVVILFTLFDCFIHWDGSNRI